MGVGWGGEEGGGVFNNSAVHLTHLLTQEVTPCSFILLTFSTCKSFLFFHNRRHALLCLRQRGTPVTRYHVTVCRSDTKNQTDSLDLYDIDFESAGCNSMDCEFTLLSHYQKFF